MRIIICGLNGAGKSTLGRALAGQLHYEFRDIEDYKRLKIPIYGHTP